jgi:hypothetical protein
MSKQKEFIEALSELISIAKSLNQNFTLNMDGRPTIRWIISYNHWLKVWEPTVKYSRNIPAGEVCFKSEAIAKKAIIALSEKSKNTLMHGIF